MIEEPLGDAIVVATLLIAGTLGFKYAGDIGLNAVALLTLTLWCVFLLAVRLTLVMFGM